MDLCEAVYFATRNFPKQEMSGLTNQLRRASVSIVSNIAEGKGRTSVGELAQFLGMARGSALEVQTQLELAMRLKFGDHADLLAAQQLSVEVLRILNATLTTLRAKSAQKSRRG